MDEKPKIIKTISFFFFLITLTYGSAALLNLGIILVMEWAIRSYGGPEFYFLKSFPTLGLIPIIFSITTLVFLFIAFKTREGSRKAWWLGTISLLVIPFSLAFLATNFLAPLVNIGNLSGAASTPTQPLPAFNFQNLVNLSYSFLIFEIALLLLFVSFKKFQFEPQELSKKAKISLALLFLLFVLPILIFMNYAYLKALDTDYGYSKVKTTVNYRVYKPTFIPRNFVNSTKFFIYDKEFAGKSNAVFVAYDLPLKKLMSFDPNNIENKGLITMIQVGVESNFSLKDFAETFIRDKSKETLGEISLKTAKNKKAYLIKKPVIVSLKFITPENVLISISGPGMTEEELIQFAESLR